MDQNKVNHLNVNNSPQAPVNNDPLVDIPPLQDKENPNAPQNPSTDNYQVPNTISFTTSKKKSTRKRKIIATILGLLLMIGGLGTGVYLSQQSQNIREKAATDKCDEIIDRLCNDDGTCKKKGMCQGCCRGKPNTPQTTPSPQRPDLCQSANVNKKTLKPGETITITSTSKEPANYFMYAVYNMDNLYDPPPENNPKPVCVKDGGDITTAQDICPPGSHLLIFEDPNKEPRTEGKRTLRYEELFVKDELTGKVVSNLSITAYFQKEGQPISVPMPACVVRTISSEKQDSSVECLDVKAYQMENNNWRLLNSETLSKLKPGDTVYFTITGKSKNPNMFKKAKFKVNNENPVEVDASKEKPTDNPEEKEIYYQYKIPEGVVNFTVKAAIYHEGIGWIGDIN